MTAAGALREITAPGGAREAWLAAGCPPLEPLAEMAAGSGLIRIPAPGQAGWASRDGTSWRRTPAPALPSWLAADHGRPVAARLLLARRGTPDVITVLADAGAVTAREAAGWLGWPGTGAASISEALASRSNDYRALDLAAAALGLGPMDTARSPALPFPDGISVILPARGVGDVLPLATRAIAAAAAGLAPGTPWEALIVDDASDPPLALPEGLPRQIRIVRSERRLHCGGARNRGAALAGHGLLVFCDADTVLAPGYLREHAARHLIAPNLITVSLREYLPAGCPVPGRDPGGQRDTRAVASYEPGRPGLVPVTEPVTVRPLAETRGWRDFGSGRLLGPVDLPFMVKGNNLAVGARTAGTVPFPPDFTGWGPEDVCFAARAIARGAFVIPVLSTGVFHLDHPPRSGSPEIRDAELAANLRRYARHLAAPAGGPWPGGTARR
ncbi:MAG TPA: glycosyltransferase [Streptosporangiaceae bacterium]|nr:glycosyltransferase [Streptosporangiaceae bacterium]HVB46115.1 glycosyltransferase [Streptosporangiaceae bacterium]